MAINEKKGSFRSPFLFSVNPFSYLSFGLSPYTSPYRPPTLYTLPFKAESENSKSAPPTIATTALPADNRCSPARAYCNPAHFAGRSFAPVLMKQNANAPLPVRE